MEPSYWEESLVVSASGESVAGVVFIISLSPMFFVFPFKTVSVSSSSPGDRKRASEEISEAVAAVEAGAVEVGEVEEKTSMFGLYSLLGVMGRLVAPFATPSFISLLFVLVYLFF